MHRTSLFPPVPAMLRAPALAAALALLGTLSACGGGGDAAPPPPAAVIPVITLAAPVTQPLAGSTVPIELSATSSDGGAISWTLAAGSPGSLSAASGAKVSYVPPLAGAVQASTAVTVTASSGGGSKAVSLTLLPETSQPGLYLLAGNPAAQAGDAPLDGPAGSVSLKNLDIVRTDGAGNYYVLTSLRSSTDAAVVVGFVIRKIANGTVSTLLRTGPGASWFGQPQVPAEVDVERSALSDFVVDRAGNLHVLVIKNATRVIYKITPQGGLSLLAGNPALTAPPSDGVDGIGAAAVFNAPRLIGLDADNNLYVADLSNFSRDQVFRKVSPAGVVSTQAALPAGVSASASNSAEINGVVYTADATAAQIGRYTPDLGYDVAAGVQNKQGIVLGALPGGLDAPVALLARGNSLVVASGGALLVLVPAPAQPKPMPELQVDAVFTETLAGGKPLTLSARANGRVSWSMPAGSPGTLTAIDDKTARYTPPPASAVTRNTPITVTASYGNTTQALRLTVFPEPGAPGLSLLGGSMAPVSAAWQDGPPGVGSLFNIYSVSGDRAGNVYLVQSNKYTSFPDPQLTLRKIAPDGMLTTVFRGGNGRAGEAFADDTGNVFISFVARPDRLSERPFAQIYRLAADGTLSAFAGNASLSYSFLRREGVGPVANLVNATISGMDSRGTLWLADGGTVAADGTVRWPAPASVTRPDWSADMNGNTYAVEGQTIVRRAPDGSTTVIAGNGTPEYYTGALPGKVKSPYNLTRIGPATYVFVSGSAVMKLVVPH